MDSAALSACLDSFPRLALADTPTPLETLPNLGKGLECSLWVKRDDCMGPGLGGNKIRKLEYLLADAQRWGASSNRKIKVVTFGGLQSNHARLTAAAAVRLGMEPHLFYFERRPARLQGNLLINQILGAKLHFIPMGGSGGMTIEQTIRLVRLVSFAMLGPNYFIPVGGHNWLGCLGYVRAALELDTQIRQLGLEQATLVAAAGSGGTLAGLMAGLALLRSPLRLLGIDVGRLWKGFPASIARLASELCTRLGEPLGFKPAGVPLVENTYVGERYGAPSSAGAAAMQRMARSEGLLLDPVYTGKAFAGLLDRIERKELGQDGPVIFLHTGGAPAMFADL